MSTVCNVVRVLTILVVAPIAAPIIMAGALVAVFVVCAYAMTIGLAIEILCSISVLPESWRRANHWLNLGAPF